MENRKEYFDHQAEHWDDRIQYERKYSQLLEVVKGFDLQKGFWVLDVGTGTGVLLPLLREAIGEQGRLFGMDFSFKMLEQARRREKVKEGIFINASVEAIPIGSNHLDRVTCFSAFPHFPDKRRALVEMVRVLKKGGKLFIAQLYSVEEINQLHQNLGGPVARDFLPFPEQIQGLMRESGLHEISIVNQPGRFLAEGVKR